MHRKLAWLWIILILLSIVAPTLVFARPAHQEEGLLATVTDRTRFRDGPGTEWYILGVLDEGTPIRLDAHDPTGEWVRGIVPGGKVGWVVVRGLSITSEQALTLPEKWVDDPFTLPAPEGTPAFQSPPANAEPANDQSGAPALDSAPANPLPGGGLVVEVASRANLRTEPGGGQVLATLPLGTTLSVDGKNATQEWVRGSTSDGAKGWIAVRFVFITGDQMVGLPVVEGGASAAPAAPAPSGDPAQPTEVVPAPVVAAVNSSPVRGFNLGGHVEGFGDGAVNRMRQAGMTWAKRQYRYYVGADPNSLAGWINDAHAKGFRILIGIVGVNSELNNPGYFEQYASFVGSVAALGTDAIEVWNEQNIDREWPSGSIDPGRYVQLLRLSYNAIKAANSGTLVISGALAPTGFFGGCSGAGCDDAPYLSGMMAAGAGNYADCIGAHYNEGIVSPDMTSGDPRGNSSHYTRYFWGMMNTYGRIIGSKPLCFTELGYLTPQGFPPLPGGFAWAENVTLAQQAAWLDRAVSLAANSGRVRLLIIWNVDFTYYGDDPMGGYAIIRPDGSCPACEALGS